MTEDAQNFYRNELLKGLSQLSEKHIKNFKRMYSFKSPDKTIEQVVENMDCDKLDHALFQVQNTLKKIKNSPKEIEK